MIGSSVRIVDSVAFLSGTASNGRSWFSDSRRPASSFLKFTSSSRCKDKKEVQKTKEIANLWIHVERAINSIKNYRILKGTLSITVMQHVDEIFFAFSELCNTKMC